MSHSVRMFLGALLCSLLTFSGAWGQQQAGVISGLVTDPSGAAVAGVGVTLEDVARNLTRTTTSTAVGVYTFPNVDVGEYAISAEMSGFKRLVVPNVVVQVGQSVRVDLALQLGEVAESVEVAAAAIQLQTADSQISGVVENKAIIDLPLNGRNFTQLMVLMPGAVERGRGTVSGHYVERGAGTSFSVNGIRSTMNQFLIDGFHAKEVQHGTNSIEPIIDALQEFRVASSNYTAEFGTEAGGQINATLKSGTNEFHGSAWNFLRNDALDANNFFNNRSGIGKAKLRRNQFGVVGGGPIILPKLYHGRNRSFVFGAWESTRQRQGRPQFATLPTQALRDGDFSGLTTINDPFTGQPFENNFIPVTRRHQISTKMLDRFVPQPNLAGRTPASGGGQVIDNWISNDPQRIDVDQLNWRVDHRISEQDSIFGHYLFEDTAFRYPKLVPTDDAAQEFRGNNLLLAYTHLYGPATLLELRAGWSRFSQNEFQPFQFKEDIAGEFLGMRGLCNAPICWGTPQLNPSGYTTIGQHGGQPGSSPRAWRNELFQWQGSLYHTVGAHNLKMGAIVKRHRDNFPEAIDARGTYTFDGRFTGVGGNSINAFADYLLGIPRTVSASIDIFSPHFRNSMVEPWIQDDWRVSSELTVNLGLRWEWAGRPVSKDGSISTVVTHLPEGPKLITGQDAARHGFPASLAFDDFNNFAPRIGLAYSPRWSKKTVFRSAYGIFYQRELANTWVDLAINLPFIRQTQYNLETNPASEFYFANFDFFDPLSFAPPRPLLVFAIDNFWKDGMVQQWNFNIQRDLGYSTILEVGYVGNHATYLPRRTFVNQAPPGPGDIQARRPLQGFGTIHGLDSGADSNYHGFQMKVQKNYSHGLMFINSYTYSKCIDNSSGTFIGEAGGGDIQDNNNFRAQRALCTQDVRQRLSSAVVYDLPFGKGRRFGASAHPLVDGVIGGWQFNFIYTARSGEPLTASIPGNPANTGDGSTFPNKIGDPQDIERVTPERGFNTDAFAGLRSAAAPMGVPDCRVASVFDSLSSPKDCFGSAGRNSVISPGINNWDLSIFKAFKLDERRSIQLRGEFFNAFNRTQFNLPGGSVGTASFGVITSTSRDPRDVQLSLKFLW